MREERPGVRKLNGSEVRVRGWGVARQIDLREVRAARKCRVGVGCCIWVSCAKRTEPTGRGEARGTEAGKDVYRWCR